MHSSYIRIEEYLLAVNKINLILANSKNVIPDPFDSDEDMSTIDLSEGVSVWMEDSP